MKALSLSLSVISLLAVGCSPAVEDDCGVLVWVDPRDGAFTRELTLDFGSVFACEGWAPIRELELRNDGRCAVELDGLMQVSGDPVSVSADSPAESWTFQVLAERGRIEPGQSIQVRARTGELWSESSWVEPAEAQVIALGTKGESATLVLGARLMQGDWEAPGEFAFGAVMVGDAQEMRYTIRNPTQRVETYTVVPPTSSSHPGAFSLAPESAVGEVEIPPDSSRDIVVRFHPTEQGAHVGEMKLQLTSCGPEVKVPLTGEGVDRALTWEPFVSDFGCVPPSLEQVHSIEFTNLQGRPIVLSQLKALNASEFRIVSPSDGILEIPAATRDAQGDWMPGTATIVVAFKPLQLGPRQTQLKFQTDHPTQSTGFITLKGFGCGPDIELTPDAVLDFSVVSGPQTKTITIMNVGTLPPAPDPRANLLLGTINGSGNYGAPFIELVSVNPADAADAFSVLIPSTYDPSVGLEAKAGKNQVTFEVSFDPPSVGLKEAELRIFSNDLDEPVTTILVRGEAILAP
ncbi:MAG: choice-of-anchor D domain-containing protein [Myxococcaceae bacterium]